MEKRVCVLLAPGFEEIEALTPVDYLRRAGVVVDVVSTIDDIVVEGTHQILIQADTFLSDIQLKDYEAIIVPGGLPGVPNLAKNEDVIGLLQAAQASNLWIAAICAGPMVLEQAGILNGKCVTCYPGVETSLPSAKETGKEVVVVDENIITSTGCGSAGYFSLRLIEKLMGEDVAKQISEKTVMPQVEQYILRTKQ